MITTILWTLAVLSLLSLLLWSFVQGAVHYYSELSQALQKIEFHICSLAELPREARRFVSKSVPAFEKLGFLPLVIVRSPTLEAIHFLTGEAFYVSPDRRTLATAGLVRDQRFGRFLFLLPLGGQAAVKTSSFLTVFEDFSELKTSQDLKLEVAQRNPNRRFLSISKDMPLEQVLLKHREKVAELETEGMRVRQFESEEMLFEYLKRSVRAEAREIDKLLED